MYQRGKYSLLLGKVVVGVRNEEEVITHEFIINIVSQQATRFTVDVYMKEEKMAVSFCHHSKLDIYMDTVQMVSSNYL